MMKRMLSVVLGSALLLVGVSACSPVPSGGSNVELRSVEAGQSAFQSDSSAASGASTDRQVEPGQSIISTGELQLSVDHPAEAASEVRSTALKLGGSVESEFIGTRLSSTADTTGAVLTVRVPSERFEEALTEFSRIGTVVSQQRSAVDVTLQHADLDARVTALQASVDQLTELMRGAATISELIEAESALAQRQQELDGLTAQLNALENQVAESTITISLSTTSVIPGGPATFWDGLLAGLSSLSTAGAAALVILGVLLPWVVLLAGLGGVTLLIIWLARRGRQRKE